MQKILRRPGVEAKTGLKRSAIYGKMKFNPNRPWEYDPSFPKPISLGAKAVGWLESEIDQWLEERAGKRQSSIKTPG